MANFRIVSRLFHFLLFLLPLISCELSEKKTGIEYFKEGERLVTENQLDEAAMNFWASVLGHQPEFPYTAETAFNSFLSCYKMQGKLALGYAFIAAQMYRMKDGRAREYLKKAYDEDPTHEKILQLLEYMDETETSILLDKKIEKPKKRKPQRNESSRRARGSDRKTHNPVPKDKPHACRNRKSCEKYIKKPDLRSLEVGWEDVRERNYIHTKSKVQNSGKFNVTIPPMESFEVAYDKFWRVFDDKENKWKAETFNIIHKYLTKETIYIDVGAYIGPTIFFASQIAKRSFGLEPDPVSLATIEHNLVLNPGKNIHVHGVAAVTPSDAGYIQLETDKLGSGDSMVVEETAGTKKEQFEAAGFTLPFLTTLWGIKFEENPVFIRISVEPYECKLIPSFHEWLLEEKIENLTILVAFDSPCTKLEMESVLRTFKLFQHVSCSIIDNKALPINTETSFAEFEKVLEREKCFATGDQSHFLLSGKPSIKLNLPN